MVILRNGIAMSQKDAIPFLNANPAFLFATEDEAARDGFARLRPAAARRR
jgi:hypothetical protein